VQRASVTPRTFLRITQVTVVIVVLNIVTGAAVRLTGSGLGCPDWPTCTKDRLTPSLSFHPAIEFGNRMVVVVLCIATGVALVAALLRSPRRRDLVWLSGGLLGGVIGEAVLGAVVVYTKLNPYAVMTHFMVGIVLLTDAFVLALRAGRADRVDRSGGTRFASASRRVSKVAPRERRISQVMIALLAAAIAAGTATTGAGPHAGGPGAKRLPITLEDMARVHSAIVLCLVALTLAFLYLLDHVNAPKSVLDRARVLLAVMVGQGAIGYAQYFTHLPAALVGVHVFGATLVWMAMLWFYDGLSHSSDAPPGTPVLDDDAHEHEHAAAVEQHASGDVPAPVGAGPASPVAPASR
jgi:heme a synthase